MRNKYRKIDKNKGNPDSYSREEANAIDSKPDAGCLDDLQHREENEPELNETQEPPKRVNPNLQEGVHDGGERASNPGNTHGIEDVEPTLEDLQNAKKFIDAVVLAAGLYV